MGLIGVTVHPLSEIGLRDVYLVVDLVSQSVSQTWSASRLGQPVRLRQFIRLDQSEFIQSIKPS